MTPSEGGAFGIRGWTGSLKLWMALLVIVHAVGLTGVVLLDANLILDLTVVNLLLTALVVLGFGHADDAWRWALTAYITYAVEVVGVQTGFPFGDYQYGKRLGPVLYDTPPHDWRALAPHPHGLPLLGGPLGAKQRRQRPRSSACRHRRQPHGGL